MMFALIHSSGRFQLSNANTFSRFLSLSHSLSGIAPIEFRSASDLGSVFLLSHSLSSSSTKEQTSSAAAAATAEEEEREERKCSYF